jgi:hypothetical protein
MNEHVGFELSSWPIEAKDPPVCVTWSCPPTHPRSRGPWIPRSHKETESEAAKEPVNGEWKMTTPWTITHSQEGSVAD